MLRSRLAGGTAVLCLLLMVSCGGEAGRDNLTAGAESDPIRVVEERPNAPLYPRVVGAGEDVVLLGGVVPKEDGLYLPVGTAVAVDDDGQTRQLQPEPFEPPLLDPGTVWTGDEVIALGNPCGMTSLAENPMPGEGCKEATLRAGALSVSADEWRTIDVPAMVASKHSDAQFFVSGVGWTGEEALFSVMQGSGARSYWLYNPETGSWRSAPAPPSESETDCFHGGQWLAARAGSLDPNTGVIDPAAGTRTPQITTWRLDTGDVPRWVELAPFDKPDQAPLADTVACSGGLVYASDSKAGVDRLWFDQQSKRWESVPRLDIEPEVIPASTVSKGSRLVWPAQGDSFFVLANGAQSWVRHARPPSVSSAAKAMGVVGDRVFVTTQSRSSEVDQLALVDPSAGPS
jgi:hypothetical protein